MTLAETTPTELRRAHPVVLTPGDEAAARRLAAACSCQGEDLEQAVSGPMAELARRAGLAEQVRDEWIARTVQAEDALTQRDRLIDRLHTELDCARNTNHRHGDQLARQHATITELRAQLQLTQPRRCARCGRSAATHLLIRDHSFTHDAGVDHG